MSGDDIRRGLTKGINWKNRNSAEVSQKDLDRIIELRLTEADLYVIDRACEAFLRARYRPMYTGEFEEVTAETVIAAISHPDTRRHRILMHLVTNLANRMDMNTLASRRTDKHKRKERVRDSYERSST